MTKKDSGDALNLTGRKQITEDGDVDFAVVGFESRLDGHLTSISGRGGRLDVTDDQSLGTRRLDLEERGRRTTSRLSVR